MSALSAQNLASGAAQSRNDAFGAGSRTPTDTPHPIPNPSAGPSTGDRGVKGLAPAAHGTGHEPAGYIDPDARATNPVTNTISDIAHHGASAILSRGANMASDIVQGAANLGIDYSNAMNRAYAGGAADVADWVGAHGTATDIRNARDKTAPIPEITMPKFERDSNTDALNKVGGHLDRNPDVGTAWSGGLYVPGKGVESALRVVNAVGTVATFAGGGGLKGLTGVGVDAAKAVGDTAVSTVVKTGTKEAVESATGAVQGIKAAAKAAATHDTAAAKTAAEELNQTNMLNYLKSSGTEAAPDAVNPITRTQAAQAAYRTTVGTTKKSLAKLPGTLEYSEEQAAAAATKPVFGESSVVKEGNAVTAADRTPGSSSFGSDITKPAAKAHEKLVSEINKSGGETQKFIDDVESAFPKEKLRDNRGAGGKGSGEGGGEGEGLGQGNGPEGSQGSKGSSGGGKGNSVGNKSGLRRENVSSGARGSKPGFGDVTKTDIPDGHAVGGRHMPPEGEPLSRPQNPANSPRRPQNVPGGTSPMGTEDEVISNVGTLTHSSTELANESVPTFSGSTAPVREAQTAGARDALGAAGLTAMGTTVGSTSAINQGVNQGVLQGLTQLTVDGTKTKVSTAVHTGDGVSGADDGGGGGGGGHHFDFDYNQKVKGQRMWQQLGR